MLFDEKTRQYLPPRTRGGPHPRSAAGARGAPTPAGRTEPGRALAEVGELADRRSLMVLFADLLDAPADLADRLRQLRSRGHDVVLFHLLDPDEVELPFDELTRLRGDRARRRAPAAGRPARSRGVVPRANRRRCASAGGRPAWRRASSTGSRRPPSRPPTCCAPSCSRASGRAGSTRTHDALPRPVPCCSAWSPRRCRGSSTASAGGARGRCASRRWSSCCAPSARSRRGGGCATSRCWSPARRWRRRCRWRSRARSPRCAPTCRR